MSALQDKCLQVLRAAHEHDPWMDILFLQAIADRAGVTRREARIAVRALARKGLVKREGVFSEDTGLAAGSGYRLA